MNPSHGWIKLYRTLLDDPLWQCGTAEQKVILVTLLLMANHAETRWQWQGKPCICRPGQMITSLKSIQKKCGNGVSIRNIRTALKRFEQFGFLTNQPSNHSRLISICHWSLYQDTTARSDKQTDNPLTIDCQANDKQLTPNKNGKKNQKEKKASPSQFHSLSFEVQDIRRAQAATADAMAAFLNNTANEFSDCSRSAHELE